MRKSWYAGAVAALLVGAAVPAQADGRTVENPRHRPPAGGLLPDGASSSPAELFDRRLPPLGGLAGLPLSNTLPRDPGVPDVSGLPAGGMTVVPAIGEPEPAVTLDDPRLPAEPIARNAAPPREFSPNGRPVAGVDPQYR
ncbi:hypothetical protein ODJ79_26085 [Actinoplanes sp. KI2]|uniref:hypothetical protein n=1 Tax=Actinoplanes sp. KI2 TaxID=2983315 RepID=UPI0021D58BCE|nr:hypothetical protein [Actinoplanes sp. KI2]MCU7727214.1 hypothetical protein [Actinoplanes sp. KI2]